MSATEASSQIAFRYSLIVPLLFVIGVILIYPIGFSFWVSLQDYKITQLNDISFIGFENYFNLTDHDSFQTALQNTLIFVIAAVSLEFMLGLFLAYLLYRQRTLQGVLRTIILSPMFITPIAVGLIFRFLLNSQLGIIPYLLGEVNLEIEFFGPNLALISIILIDVWQWTPFIVLLLLAGLESLPEEPLEAATMDGANGLQILWYVLLPILRPTIMAAIIIRGLDAFKVFEYVWAITRGGPGERTEVLLFQIYREGFRFFRMGQAAAMGYVVVIVILTLVILVYWALAVLPEWQYRRRARQIERSSQVSLENSHES